ncbi:MAG: hypothetical protein Q4D95_06780, partial [Peptoniphilus sp.]|nr:hypothetical protein [Peptoniphilus sp.]
MIEKCEMCDTRQIEKNFCSINIMRACAALLIINSHYDDIYPFPALATGGAIGNAIFFAVSGFCSYPIAKEIMPWIVKKIIKV